MKLLLLLFSYLLIQSCSNDYDEYCPCNSNKAVDNIDISEFTVIHKHHIGLLDKICIIIDDKPNDLYSNQMKVVKALFHQLIQHSSITNQLNISLTVIDIKDNDHYIVSKHDCLLSIHIIDDILIHNHNERFNMRWKQYLNCPGMISNLCQYNT